MKVKLLAAGERHVEFVRLLAGEVFSRFGDYASLLPPCMREATVRTVVAEKDGEPVGFAMYDLVQADEGVVDLTAIAVAPAYQGQGVGRRLLEHVEQQARALAFGPAPCVLLTVAEDNWNARRLFEQAGYRRLPIPTGRYAGGQRSQTLRKLLVDPEWRRPRTDDRREDPEDDDSGARDENGDDAALVTAAEVTCPLCGVTSEIRLDPAAGATQEYVEDCEVCCQPWRVRVRFAESGDAVVEVAPAQ